MPKHKKERPSSDWYNLYDSALLWLDFCSIMNSWESILNIIVLLGMRHAMPSALFWAAKLVDFNILFHFTNETWSVTASN